MRLRFDGLATIAQAWLNGTPVLQSANMFTGWAVDVTEPLAPAVIQAMHKAVDDMATRSTFKGYGDEQGYAHQAPMPQVPGPEKLPTDLELLSRQADRIPEPLREKFLCGKPIDLPPVTGLLVANEWLDDVPLDVVEQTGDGPRLVLVDADGAGSLGPAPALSVLSLKSCFLPASSTSFSKPSPVPVP